ncbi:MAG: xanthine dehydrogenase family protein molybdopterin-binding subunit [Lachnospirales bacterium]
MKVIGKDYPIHDAVGKVTGKTIYVGDMEMQNMAHAAVIFSDISHGIVTEIDDSEALKVEGVIKILTCFNTTQRMYNRYRREAKQLVEDEECIFNKHVRFVGDKIGVVIAETEDIARKAVNLIKITYKKLPHSFSTDETLTGIINGIHEYGVIATHECEIGNKDLGQSGEVTVTTTTKFPSIDHLTMETHGVVASYEKSNNFLTIWSPCQSVHGIRTVLADLLVMPYSNVRAIKATMGASFGAKQEIMLEPIAAISSIETERPVKLIYNRKEDFISTISRGAVEAKITSKFKKDGTLTALYPEITLNAGAYLANSHAYIRVMAGKLFRAYKYDYANYKAKAVITNTPVSGGFRGWAAPEITIPMEHNFNEAAKILNMDPLELRLKNVAEENDIDIFNDISLGEIKIKDCLTKGGSNFHWETKKKDTLEFNKINTRYKRGIGVACGGHVSGFYPKLHDFSMAEIRLCEDSSVILNVTMHDHGCGTVRAMQMIVAEILGIDVDKIRAEEGDTNKSPYETGCYSSKTTYVLGKAVYNCAENLLEEIKSAASEILKVDKDDIIVMDGSVTLKSNSDIKMTYGDIAVKSIRELQKEILAISQYTNVSNPGTVGAHFAEVEVDTYTGMTKILSYTAACDIGKALNPAMCIAQIQGAVIMGAGGALTEHTKVSPSGLSTTSIKDYHVINAFESPQIDVVLIEEGKTDGPFGAKSIGEISHIPVSATIAGAVNNALNSSIGDLPLNPDKIADYLSR